MNICNESWPTVVNFLFLQLKRRRSNSSTTNNKKWVNMNSNYYIQKLTLVILLLKRPFFSFGWFTASSELVWGFSFFNKASFSSPLSEVCDVVLLWQHILIQSYSYWVDIHEISYQIVEQLSIPWYLNIVQLRKFITLTFLPFFTAKRSMAATEQRQKRCIWSLQVYVVSYEINIFAGFGDLD